MLVAEDGVWGWGEGWDVVLFVWPSTSVRGWREGRMVDGGQNYEIVSVMLLLLCRVQAEKASAGRQHFSIGPLEYPVDVNSPDTEIHPATASFSLGSLVSCP